MTAASTRLVLVTGGAGAIGAAIVRRFVALGHPVVCTHLGQAEAAADLEAELGTTVHAVESDTSDPQAVAELHADLEPAVLVCCAGIARDGMIWKQPVEDFDAVIAANLRGAWLQVREASVSMRRAGWGRIVLIGSINGSRGKAGQTAYAASKAGLIGLARSAAKELGRKGITVNVIEPGWIDTPMTLSVPAEFRDAARAETLTGRLGEPDDVAAACAFLASEEAAHLTGQVLRVDGGQHLA